MMSLFRPGEKRKKEGRDVSASSFALLPSLPFSSLLLPPPQLHPWKCGSKLTVRSERSPDDLGELSYSLDVTENGFLQTRKMLKREEGEAESELGRSLSNGR